MLEQVLKRADKDSWRAGLAWYGEAQGFARDLSKRSGMPLPKVCGVIAALSPRVKWETNKTDAEAMVLGLLEHNFSSYGAMVDKARRIVASDGRLKTIKKILNGPKITAFFLNILSPRYEAVTVDTHIHLAYLGEYLNVEKRPRLSAKDYVIIAKEIERLGRRYKVRPQCIQAVIWVTWRKLCKI